MGRSNEYDKIMKKVLIPSLCSASPHLETELEIMEHHFAQGNDVYYVCCNREIKTCFLHQSPSAAACRQCRKQLEVGLSLLSKKPHLLSWPDAPEMHLQRRYPVTDVAELKDLSVDGKNWGLSVASTLISLFENEDFNTLAHDEIIQDNLDAAQYTYNAFGKLLDVVQPDMVYVFNGRFSVAAPILTACKERNTPFFTHERANVDDRYRTVAQNLPHDVLPIMQECEELYERYGHAKAKQIAHEFYAHRKDGSALAGIVHTRLQTRQALPEGFDVQKKNIVFYNSSIFEFAALPGFDSLTGCYPTEENALLRVAQDALVDPTIHIYCRMHPNLSGKNTRQVNNLLALTDALPNLTIIPPESSVDSYALMEQASTVVVFHSTIGAESAYWEKPVVVAGFATYGSLEGFYTSQSHAELMQLLLSDLAPLPPVGAIKYGLWMQEGGIPYKYYSPSTMFSGTFKGVDINKTASRALLPGKIVRALLALSGLHGADAAKKTLRQVKRKLSSLLSTSGRL